VLQLQLNYLDLCPVFSAELAKYEKDGLAFMYDANQESFI
jgi:hypothetical protein